jgi:hypothetical protein
VELSEGVIRCVTVFACYSSSSFFGRLHAKAYTLAHHLQNRGLWGAGPSGGVSSIRLDLDLI